MDINQILHDEIMANRTMAIEHPDLLRWSQDRIDSLYAIKRVLGHRVEPEHTGQHFSRPRIKHG